MYILESSLIQEFQHFAESKLIAVIKSYGIVFFDTEPFFLKGDNKIQDIQISCVFFDTTHLVKVFVSPSPLEHGDRLLSSH
jgi:hypothetical protein